MLAIADPHLVAGEAIAGPEWIIAMVRAVGHGSRHDVGQARARLRLRQTHRAEPLALELVERERCDLCRRAVHQQQVGIARRQHAPATEPDAGLGEEHVCCQVHHVGQLHAAEFVVLRSREHAALDVGAGGVVAALRQHDVAIDDLRLLHVHQAIERRELLRRDALARVEHGLEGGAAVVGVAGPRRERGNVEPVVEQEIDGLAHGILAGPDGTLRESYSARFDGRHRGL